MLQRSLPSCMLTSSMSQLLMPAPANDGGFREHIQYRNLAHCWINMRKTIDGGTLMNIRMFSISIPPNITVSKRVVFFWLADG